ncbi:putative ribonuclease H protein [Vitis vinifera]|uniref:Putative ribonuclease H protein n=1 Tax=Vitis vinifera TaxID=29760 RepID=A0A438DHG7_VITVI|nr:putative ribonuclease H protein [Vitis vinifera]
MPTEGFEEEILYLLRRMKGRMEQKGREGVTRKTNLKSSKSSRELKKLEWTGGGAGGMGNRSILNFVSFKNCVDGVVWVFTGVYGPVCSGDREEFWEELGFPEERSRGGGLTASMRRFSEVVEDLELRDYPLRGGPFTWRGGILPRPVSDHFPILLEGGGLKRGLSPFSMEDCEARNGAREAYKSWVIKEEIFWRQKSRELWLKEGDNNTRFFHRMANAHSRRNWLAVPGGRGWRPSVDGISFMRLDISEAEGLEIPFLEEEVLAALTDLGKDKAPGPDGFTMAFWLYGWDVVKLEIMGFFREFHERGRFVKSLNATFLVLVPKKSGAEDLKDFRPISLVGSLYKLLAKVLAKVLANRIKKIEKQSRSVMCKLDIEKAYDHVDWKFLLAVLKQMGFGNPLSPYLFVIAMEVFSCLMRRAISGGFLSGWRARGRGGEGILISHFLFADDTLVFCEESQDQLTYLSWLLMWFEACSGLKVNLEKSELIPVGRVNDIEDLALELGCKVGGLPSSYLGLPLGASFKSEAVWDCVEERFRKRKVRMRLEKIQRDFLWGGGALDQRPHLVRWNLVCLERKKGGLGVRNLALMNKALLDKWNWRFAIEREVLWKKVISHKYGVEKGGWCTRAERGRYGVGLWKAIRKEWLGMYSSLAFRVGNGRKVRFWKDKWCGDEPLYESFPSLFAISRAKDVWVSEVWNPDGVGDGWTPLFSRALNDWEIEMMEQFMLKIQAFRVQREIEDKMVWTASRSGAFSVKSLYSTLEPGGSAMFPYVGIWSARVPPKVFSCLTEAEMVDHLLLHCVMTRTLWNLLFSLFGVEWVLSGTVKETLLGWHGAFVGKSVKRRGKWPPYVYFGQFGRKEIRWLWE